MRPNRLLSALITTLALAAPATLVVAAPVYGAPLAPAQFCVAIAATPSPFSNVNGPTSSTAIAASAAHLAHLATVAPLGAWRSSLASAALGLRNFAFDESRITLILQSSSASSWSSVAAVRKYHLLANAALLRAENALNAKTSPFASTGQCGGYQSLTTSAQTFAAAIVRAAESSPAGTARGVLTATASASVPGVSVVAHGPRWNLTAPAYRGAVVCLYVALPTTPTPAVAPKVTTTYGPCK